MKAIYVLGIILMCSWRLEAQSYTLKKIESHFLENNFYLLAKKYQVAENEARVIQEKVFPNPSLAISEVNLWTNSSAETLPALWGKSGTNQQIAMELEQLIETAGKRKKRVAIREAEVKQAAFEFEETLRELRKELRINFWNLYYFTENQKQTEYLLNLYKQLSEQYTKQASLQNTSQVQAARANAAYINLQAENSRWIQEQNEALKMIRSISQINDIDVKTIDFENPNLNNLKDVPLSLREMIKEQNITLKLQETKIDLAEKQLILEKAIAKPDLNAQINFDRGGNIMHNFVGLGLRMDLPVFNRNKGNILAAKHQIQQENHLASGLKNTLENEINSSLNQLQIFDKLLKDKPVSIQNSSEELLQNYLKHLQARQVTLMEFLDFAESHLEAKQTENEWFNQYISIYEYLRYLAGKDF